MSDKDKEMLKAYRAVAHYTITSLEQVTDELDDAVNYGNDVSGEYEDRRREMYRILSLIRNDADR